MMKKKINILLSSVGRRSYLVKYFQEALGDRGEIHVANSTPLTPVFSLAVNHVVTPMIYDKEYVPFLLQYCINNHISAIISLFDVDLPILSMNKSLFHEEGVEVIVSSKEVIDICNDKWKTFHFCKANSLPTPNTYLTLKAAHDALSSGKLNFPVIVKPRWGMGSIGLFEADNGVELDILYEKVEKQIMKTYLKYESIGNPGEMVLIQEKLSGLEHGLDIINNLKGEYQNTIVKLKYSMRAGETDCAETVENEQLKKLGEKISILLHHIANLDVDVFLDDNTPYILEMNARFGGGYPFSHMAGVNLPLVVIKWLAGESVDADLLIARNNVLSHKDIDVVVLQHDVK